MTNSGSTASMTAASKFDPAEDAQKGVHSTILRKGSGGGGGSGGGSKAK